MSSRTPALSNLLINVSKALSNSICAAKYALTAVLYGKSFTNSLYLNAVEFPPPKLYGAWPETVIYYVTNLSSFV